MIAIDTSAIVAIACEEPEAEAFSRVIAVEKGLVTPPVLFEARMVLEQKLTGRAVRFLDAFVQNPQVEAVPFTLDMYRAASSAFESYGKGRGHSAQLNFGDCMAYAVAKVEGIPLLYKGEDFSRTDIRRAL